MTPLSASQIDRVQGHLAAAGLPPTLHADLLDHLCCAIEEEMAAGQAFEIALHLTTAAWPLPRLDALRQDHRFTLKTKPMLLRFSAAAAILAGLCFLSPFPWPAPPAPAPAPAPTAAASPATPPAPEPAVGLLTVSFDPPTASPLANVDMRKELTSGYGMRTHPIFKTRMLHRGIDLKAKTGTPVLATAPGVVTFAADKGPYGNTVMIRHADGYRTSFMHLDGFSVSAGDEVSIGQQVGTVGSTGKSTGPHLHYEVWKDDKPIDPLAMLD